MEDQFYRISWVEVNEMSIYLARQVQGKKLYPIERSGLIVAGIMSHHGCELAGSPERADVYVDDIVDTGETIGRLQKRTGFCLNKPVAALIVRKGCAPMPTYWARHLVTKAYVLFPWEDEHAAIEQLKQGSFKGG